MLFAPQAREVLMAQAGARIATLRADVFSMTPDQCRDALHVLQQIRKLANGKQFDVEIGSVRTFLLESLQHASDADRSSSSSSSSSEAGSPASSVTLVEKDRFGVEVRSGRRRVRGGERWSALRAVQGSPVVAGVVVGVMGSAIARGTYTKVRFFSFAEGQSPPGTSDEDRFVARVSRTTPDVEKVNLRGLKNESYSVTSNKLYENERAALEAVDSEIKPVATWMDTKGRRVEVVRYFDDTLAGLASQAPDLLQNEAVAHQLASHLLDTLVRLDDNQYVHLDIKPDNILYDYKAMQAVLADFGAARKDPKTNSYVGTERFMSPEMQRAESQNVTALSDLYSVAYTLAAAMGGKSFFRTDLFQRSSENYFRDEVFVARALASLSPEQQAELQGAPDARTKNRLTGKHVMAFASKEAASSYNHWYVERFGGLEAPFDGSRLQADKSPFDSLFVRLHQTSAPIAQLVAAGLHENPAHRGSLSQWRSLLQQTSERISPEVRERAASRIAALASSERAKQKDAAFVALQQFARQLTPDSSPSSTPPPSIRSGRRGRGGPR